MSSPSTRTCVQWVYEYVNEHLAHETKCKDFIEQEYALLTFHVKMVLLCTLLSEFPLLMFLPFSRSFILSEYWDIMWLLNVLLGITSYSRLYYLPENELWSRRWEKKYKCRPIRHVLIDYRVCYDLFTPSSAAHECLVYTSKKSVKNTEVSQLQSYYNHRVTILVMLPSILV